MARSTLFSLLLMLPLQAQAPGLAPDLSTDLGQDPARAIHLVSPFAWKGLLHPEMAQVRPQHPHPRPRRHPGAIVAVEDFFLPIDAREEALARFRLNLHQSLLLAFEHPPASQGQIDLGVFMATDPSHPETFGPAMVRSLQDRYNALPPEGSPLPRR